MTEQDKLRFAELDPQQNMLLYELASFAMRNGQEEVMGKDETSTQMISTVTAYLGSHPSERPVPRPESVEVFRKLARGRIRPKY